MAAPAPLLSSPPALRDIAEPALLLDFDGTLVELAESPGAIVVPEYLATALQRRAQALDGRLAIVSGRFIADIRSHLPDCSVIISGSHGAEIESPDGSPVAARAASPMPEAALSAARDFAGPTKGLLLEEKALGIGLHYRDCPDAADEVRTFARDLASEHDLHLREGKMLFELATTNAHKGDAVRAIMAQSPFAGATPIFVGDDTTDEDAFHAVDRLGGFGVLVGEARVTAARYILPDVTAVHTWLELA